MFIEKELGYKRHWINIDSDIISEQSYLYTKYDIDQETIEYALDKNERAHMDYNRENGTITFIYNVLALEKDKEHYETIPLTFIVQDTRLVTISNEDNAYVISKMQDYVDKYQFLQLGKSGYKFSKKLEPTSPFYSYFREAIMETYQTDLGLGVDELGIKLHLFRSWIDKQSMDYIRTNYKGKTDLDKLLAYSKDKKIHLDYTTGASYHNRSLGDFTYPQNMKIQLPQTSVMGPYGVSNSRFIEFIVNMDTGRFVSEWNVYKKRKDGSIDSNPKHYKIEDGADIADTDSANYGLSKGLNADLPAYLNNSHTYLDVRHPADNAIRRKMVRKWKNPKNVLNGGRYADIVKKGGLKDLETWRQVKAEDRLQVYNAYLDYIRSHLVLNGFDSFYQETYKSQGGDKKD